MFGCLHGVFVGLRDYNGEVEEYCYELECLIDY